MRLLFKFMALLIIFAGACKNQRVDLGASISKMNGPVNLNFIGHWLDEGKKEQLLHELINEFEFLNQDIKINMQFPTYYANIPEAKFNAQDILSPKAEWDIIRINNDLTGISSEIKEPGWQKKYLVDFSEIEEFRSNTIPELLTDKTKSEFGGILPGPGVDGYNWALWCNTDVAKKVGIDVKQFDMTNEDFLSYLKAVDEYNRSHNDSIIPFFDASDWKTMGTIAIELYMSEIGDVDKIPDNHYSEKKLEAVNKVLQDIERFSRYNSLQKTNSRIICGWIIVFTLLKINVCFLLMAHGCIISG
jgi:ABC-type glycerol-3-phosphate transport system substrate-binding protein